MTERTMHIGCTDRYELHEGDVVNLIDGKSFEVRSVVRKFSVMDDRCNCNACVLNHNKGCKAADLNGIYLCTIVSSIGRYLFVPVTDVMEEL